MIDTVMGLDPGYRISGWGLIRRRGDGDHRFVDCGHIELSGLSMSARARRVIEILTPVLREYRPQAAAIESAFVAENANSALKLGLMRGALIAAVAQHGIAVEEYAPTEVKRAVTGRGRAGKAQVAYMVRAMLGIDASRALQSDAADALAVAVCHAHRISLPSAAR